MPKSTKVEISRNYFETIRNDNRRLHFDHNRILSTLKGAGISIDFVKKENARLCSENARLLNENITIARALDASVGAILFGIKNKK